MDDLLGISIAQGGAAALLALAVVMVLTGRLVPRRTYEDMREERDVWRAAYQESEAARREERDQTTEMLELSRTGVHVLQSLPRPGEVKDAPVDEHHPSPS